MRQRQWSLRVGVLLGLVVGVGAAWAAPKVVRVQPQVGKWAVGNSVVHDNLTVFPVYPQGVSRGLSSYVTLDDALRQRIIEVKEMAEAEVNRVSVTNKGSKPIYLISGDIILGGQQDRVIARDTIVPVRARNYVVEVFCVEHGRWNGSRHFSGNEIASSSLRRETQKSKDQNKVWNRVAQEARETRSQTSSGTYRAVASGAVTQKQMAGYLQAIQPTMARDRRAIGIVVAVNGRVTAADVFVDAGLFQKQLPKLLKSYALDAVQARDAWGAMTRKPSVTARNALQLLQDAERAPGRVAARSATTVNRQRESGSAVVFEAAPQSPAGVTVPPAHINVYRKD